MYIPYSFHLPHMLLGHTNVISRNICTSTHLESDFLHASQVMRKPTYCICENKDADQLLGN